MRCCLLPKSCLTISFSPCHGLIHSLKQPSSTSGSPEVPAPPPQRPAFAPSSACPCPTTQIPYRLHTPGQPSKATTPSSRTVQPEPLHPTSPKSHQTYTPSDPARPDPLLRSSARQSTHRTWAGRSSRGRIRRSGTARRTGPIAEGNGGGAAGSGRA